MTTGIKMILRRYDTVIGAVERMKECSWNRNNVEINHSPLLVCEFGKSQIFAMCTSGRLNVISRRKEVCCISGSLNAISRKTRLCCSFSYCYSSSKNAIKILIAVKQAAATNII